MEKVIRKKQVWAWNGLDFEASTPTEAAQNIKEILANRSDKFEDGANGMVAVHGTGRHVKMYEVEVTVRLIRRPEEDYLKGTPDDPEWQACHLPSTRRELEERAENGDKEAAAILAGAGSTDE